MKKISLAFEHEIEYYLFQPIIKILSKEDYEIYILTSERTKNLIEREFIENNFIYYNNNLSLGFKILNGLHRIFTILFTPHNFSDQYKRMVIKNFIYRNNIWSLFYRISFITPKSKNINKLIFDFFKWITPTFFKTNKVLVPTLNSYAFLLNKKNLEVYTVMESWDHAMKTPNSYLSKKVFLWNNDLQNDWKTYQKDNGTDKIYPLKLRFSKNNRFKNRKVKDKVVYAVAFTSLYSNPVAEKMEKQVIKDLCEITKQLNLNFLIKPRPISSEKEFKPFLEKYPHVHLGYYNAPEKNPSFYYLSDDYNKKRFNEIKDALFTINCFTTFALDSALIGVPVLQLDLRNIYPDSSFFYDNHHIKKYFISSENILKIDSDFKTEFINYFKSGNDIHHKFRLELENWVTDNDSIESSIKKMLKEIHL